MKKRIIGLLMLCIILCGTLFFTISVSAAIPNTTLSAAYRAYMVILNDLVAEYGFGKVGSEIGYDADTRILNAELRDYNNDGILELRYTLAQGPELSIYVYSYYENNPVLILTDWDFMGDLNYSRSYSEYFSGKEVLYNRYEEVKEGSYNYDVDTSHESFIRTEAFCAVDFTGKNDNKQVLLRSFQHHIIWSETPDSWNDNFTVNGQAVSKEEYDSVLISQFGLTERVNMTGEYLDRDQAGFQTGKVLSDLGVLVREAENPVSQPGQTEPPATTQQTQAVNPTASTVYLNGEAVAFEAYNIGGNNYFKLRDLAFVLSETQKQFEVGYDNATRAIALTSGEPYTAVGGEMAQGDGTSKNAIPTPSTIYLDGEVLDLVVYNIGGNNFFKLRDLMAAIDVYVGYDSTTKAITLDTSRGYEPE